MAYVENGKELVLRVKEFEIYKCSGMFQTNTVDGIFFQHRTFECVVDYMVSYYENLNNVKLHDTQRELRAIKAKYNHIDIPVINPLSIEHETIVANYDFGHNLSAMIAVDKISPFALIHYLTHLVEKNLENKEAPNKEMVYYLMFDHNQTNHNVKVECLCKTEMCYLPLTVYSFKSNTVAKIVAGLIDENNEIKQYLLRNLT